MAISPVGPLGGSLQAEPSGDDRRSDRRASRTVSGGGRAGSPGGDRVILSETARVLSRAVGEEAPQLHLSPAELREMIAPGSAEGLGSAPNLGDGTSTLEGPHAR